MRDGIHDTPEPPRWFVVCELGEGVCGCPRCFGETGALSKAYARWLRVNREILDELYRDAPGGSELGGADRESPPGASLDGLIASLRARLEE